MAFPFNIDYRARRLIESATVGTAITIPPWVQNDNTPLVITLYDSNGGDFPTRTKRAVTSYSVKVGLYAADGTQLAFQATFTADAPTSTYTGNLTANSANQTTKLGTEKSIAAYLEVEISSDGGINYETIIPRSRGQTTLEVEQISTASTSTPANETALTVQAGDGRYALSVGNTGIIFTNITTGQSVLFSLQDDGTLGPGPISL